MNNVIHDIKREFAYVNFNMIVEYIKELIDYDPNNIWAEYHHQLLDYMKNRFSRSFLVVEHDQRCGLEVYDPMANASRIFVYNGRRIVGGTNYYEWIADDSSGSNLRAITYYRDPQPQDPVQLIENVDGVWVIKFTKGIDNVIHILDEIAAGRQFYNYLRATSDKYVKLIEFQEYKLNDLLELKKEIDRIGEKDSSGTNIENPTEDSTLRKFNETPLSGNNPDLLDDTYLTESERNTITAGKRESEFTDTKDDFSSEIIIDDVERLSAIPLIRENIRNYYLEWINDIDRELFTYIPLDL